MEKEINIKELIEDILRSWWVIVIAVFAFGIAFFVYNNNFVPKKYTSYGSVYVNNKAQQIVSPQDQNNTANLVDLTTSEKLVETYVAILKTNNFFNTVRKHTDFTYTTDQLRNMVVYNSVEDSIIIEVNVTAQSPKEAQDLCKAILECANITIMDVAEVGSVKTIDDATLPLTHSYPNVTKSTFIGMLLGAFLSIAVLFLVNFFDVKIKSVEDIEKKYNVEKKMNIAVIGTIPDIDEMDYNTAKKGGKK